MCAQEPSPRSVQDGAEKSVLSSIAPSGLYTHFCGQCSFSHTRKYTSGVGPSQGSIERTEASGLGGQRSMRNCRIRAKSLEFGNLGVPNCRSLQVRKLQSREAKCRAWVMPLVSTHGRVCLLCFSSIKLNTKVSTKKISYAATNISCMPQLKRTHIDPHATI